MWLYHHHAIGGWCADRGQSFTAGDIRVLETVGQEVATRIGNPAFAQSTHQFVQLNMPRLQALARQSQGALVEYCAAYHLQAENFLKSMRAVRPF